MMTFRLWIREKWFFHRDEMMLLGITIKYTPEEYFKKYKWWLKSEYRKSKTKKYY